MNENEFKFNGKTYVAVDGADCSSCAILNCMFLKFRKAPIPPCHKIDREDGKDVHFVEKGKVEQ